MMTLIRQLSMLPLWSSTPAAPASIYRQIGSYEQCTTFVLKILEDLHVLWGALVSMKPAVLQKIHLELKNDNYDSAVGGTTKGETAAAEGTSENLRPVAAFPNISALLLLQGMLMQPDVISIHELRSSRISAGYKEEEESNSDNVTEAMPGKISQWFCTTVLSVLRLSSDNCSRLCGRAALTETKDFLENTFFRQNQDIAIQSFRRVCLLTLFQIRPRLYPMNKIYSELSQFLNVEPLFGLITDVLNDRKFESMLSFEIKLAVGTDILAELAQASLKLRNELSHDRINADGHGVIRNPDDSKISINNKIHLAKEFRVRDNWCRVSSESTQALLLGSLSILYSLCHWDFEIMEALRVRNALVVLLHDCLGLWGEFVPAFCRDPNSRHNTFNIFYINLNS